MLNFKKGKKAGFTVIELIVTAAVIVFLMATVIINYKPSNQKAALDRTAYNLSKQIRLAEEMALSSAIFNGTEPASVPAGGYGVYLSSLAEFDFKGGIFADVNGDGFYTPGDILNAEEKVFAFDMEKGVMIKEIAYLESGFSATSPKISVVFLPPDPIVNFYKSATNILNTTSEISIVLCTTQDGISCALGGQEDIIKINKIGQTDILSASGAGAGAPEIIRNPIAVISANLAESVVYGADKSVVVGDSNSSYSSDGIAWTPF